MFLLIHKKILYENSSKNPLRFEFNYIKPMDQFGNISHWYILTFLSLNTCIYLKYTLIFFILVSMMPVTVTGI